MWLIRFAILQVYLLSAKIIAPEFSSPLQMPDLPNTGIFSGKKDRDMIKTKFSFLVPFFSNSHKKKCLSIFSILLCQTEEKTKLDDYKIAVGSSHQYKPAFLLPKFLLTQKRHWHIAPTKLSIPIKDTREMRIRNQIRIHFNPQQPEKSKQIKFSLFIKKAKFFHSPLYRDKERKEVVFFYGANRFIKLTVRNENVTDRPFFSAKITAAKILSLLPSSKKRPVLLYEKNSNKYEESASVVYERLIDLGYKDAYFIINKNSDYFANIPEKYQSNLIFQHSFRHYLYFFKAKTFIGTEAIGHAIELRVLNYFARKKVSARDNDWIFLQHGVMYMISLDSPERSSFRRYRTSGTYKVVVSSELEANHFTELGRHLPEDLYKTGLPKFDRSYQNPKADKILIMPTWRIWEFNQMQADPLSTPYAQMIERIRRAIPESLADKIIVSAHPLFQQATLNSSSNKEQKESLTEAKRLDEILRDVKLLITDYSSIAYDAFYRGANVVFYWEEKDYCMKQYGEPTHLMLNESNAFGTICYSSSDLAQVIETEYHNSQSNENIARYRKIIEFHDEKNTDRLINLLKRDGLIKE